MKRVLFLTILLISLINVEICAQQRISMHLENSGIYTVPCEVNGLKLKFIFDTGAADVHLSLLDAAFMLKNGYLSKDDFIGSSTYFLADGSISDNTIVNLKEIKIGNLCIKDVRACISSKIDASLLLGQSAIQKIGKYTIDGNYLIIENSNNQDKWDKYKVTEKGLKDATVIPQVFNDLIIGKYYIANTITNLDLKERPLNGEIIASIPRGTSVLIKNTTDKVFAMILYIDKNIYGYVNKQFLTNFKEVCVENEGVFRVVGKSTQTTKSDIEIYNLTNKKMTIKIGVFLYRFYPHEKRIITLFPGIYDIISSSLGQMPYIGSGKIEAGKKYSINFN